MALILYLFVCVWQVESLFHTFIEGFCAHLNEPFQPRLVHDR